MLTNGYQSKRLGDPFFVDLRAASRPLKDIDVAIYTVALSKYYDIGEMVDTASSSQNVFRSNDLDDLKELAAKISNYACKGK